MREHPGTRPTTTSRVKEVTVDTTSIDPADHDDTLEAHYASLERGVPCYCYGGFHYIGHMVEGEDGEEVEAFEAVPCKCC